MTWTKISDDFTDDCEVLSDAAFRLHVEGLTWSNRKLLNCRIPVGDLRRFAKRPEAVSELLSLGWWELVGGEYVVVHHALYQRDRGAVVRQQAANSENGAKGGRTAGPPRERVPRTRAPRSVVAFTPESESLSESVSESPSERDRPGQAGITGISEHEETQDVVNESTGEVTTAKTSRAKSSSVLTPAPQYTYEKVNGRTRRQEVA